MTGLPDRLTAALADRYRIERELGQGGMATVYLAQDLKHDRRVALKVLKPELAAVLGAERFVVEIKTTAALQHPHILPLFDSGTADGFLYYVMPYIEGETLRSKLDRETQLGIDEAVRITREVADALDYAHRHGVIHRDIKPENILLHDGRPMVADFGIALAVSAAAGGRMTETGLSLGTPHYMSPEQATAEKEITGRSDIYSLGSVLYEMLAGRPPHLGGSAQQIIMQIVTEDAAPVTRLRKSVPPNVAAAVSKALEKVPADRFETARAFAEALGNPAYSRSVSPIGKGLPRSGAGRRVAGVMAAIAAAAVLIAGWALATRRAAHSPPVTRVGMELPDSVTLIAPGLGPRLAISRDGAHVVLAGRAGAASPARLWLRARDQLQALPIPGTEGARSPFFSPDGTRIGFFVGSTLRIVGLGGAPPLTLADTGFADLPGSTAAWGADDAIYVGGRTGLVRISSNGASRSRVSAASIEAREAGHELPDPLPNGRGVLFTIRRNPDNRAQLYDLAVLDLKTGKHHILVHGVMGRYVRPGYLVFALLDGSLMAAPFDQEKLALTGPPVQLLDGVEVSMFGAADLALDDLGTLLYVRLRGGKGAQLTWVDRDGRMTPIPATWPARDLEGPSISPDGRRVAVGVVTATGSDIWLQQLENGQQSRLTRDDANNSWPTWSPDGLRIVYSGEVKGHRVLQARRADGIGAGEVLIDEPRAIFEGLQSRDGAWTIYRTTFYERGRADIMARRTGDSASTPLIATEVDERHPALSPNGRWLAYRSNESGREEIYVRPFPNVGDGKTPVSAAGGDEPVWSHSGTELFYVNGAGALVSVIVETEPRFVAHEQRVLFPLPADIERSPGGRMYDLAADDRRFIMVRELEADRAVPDRLVLVTNWFEELKAKMAVKP
jgi:eukaryotic-like serine/threonine-protein kinase